MKISTAKIKMHINMKEIEDMTIKQKNIDVE